MDRQISMVALEMWRKGTEILDIDNIKKCAEKRVKEGGENTRLKMNPQTQRERKK